MRVVMVLLFALGAAGIAAGAIVLSGTISFVDGCADECHGGLFFGVAAIAMLCASLFTFALAVGVSGHRQDEAAAARDLKLQELRARLPRE